VTSITWGDTDRYIPDRYVKLIDGNNNIYEGDLLSGSLFQISLEHKRLHDGYHFEIGSFETLNNGASAVFGVTTPDTATYAHMTFKVDGTSQTELYIYEDSEYTGGTATTAINNNRVSSNTSVLSIYKNPTVSSLGKLLFSQSKGLSGTNPTVADNEGIFERDKEIILNKNKKYIFKFISRDDSNIVSYIGNWYEL
jgi:hypothetical protein